MIIIKTHRKRSDSYVSVRLFALFRVLIVEAQTILYTGTAERIEDRTEKNFTRDYFTD